MLADYVGIPFREQGRALTGADCWGLVVLVYRAVLGVELPSHAEAYVTTQDRAAIAALIKGAKGPWRDLEERQARPFDLVLMREAGQDCHIGILAERGMVLHTEPGGAAIMQPLWRLRRRVVGFYRLRARDE